MSLRDSDAPFVPMASAPTPPRPWPEMLVDWTRLALALGRVVGQAIPLGASPSVFDLAIDTWRWMWGLPPCSEARKAAFTLGAVGLLIDRWRADSRVPDTRRSEWEADVGGLRKILHGPSTAERAEAALRIAALHVDDARSEAQARVLGHESRIPAHERVYQREHGASGIAIGGRVYSAVAGPHIARAILDDAVAHSAHARARLNARLDAERSAKIVRAFAGTAIASLPDGPWLMTTRDMERFLDLILENEL